MVNIIFEKGDCSACKTNTTDGACDPGDCVYDSNPSYNKGKLAVDASVATAEGCQKACQADSDCEFWSWENEVWAAGNPNKFGGAAALIDGMHRSARCFLKAGFSGKTRDGTEKCSCEDRECDGYVHWEAHKSPSARGTHCGGVTQAQCSFEGATWDSSNSACEIASGADVACTAAGGQPTSENWRNGEPKYAYGWGIGEHSSHVYDRDWHAGSGPKFCGQFVAESVQSVAVTTVPDYKNSIVIAAAPHKKNFANGMLAYFDAETYEYLGCAPAGNKPEGIASTGDGKVACIDEGSAGSKLDNQGSMTMCEAKATSDKTSVDLSCNTYPLEKKHFKAGSWKHASEFRLDGVRLFGPNGNNVTHDLEPEGGAFTADGKYFVTVIQDNNAYSVFDTATKKYTKLAGLGYPTNTKYDYSDKDDKINLHLTDPPSKKMLMPDQMTHFTHNGEYYFITANEGGSRDGGDGLIGEVGDFEGEEIRMGDLTCTDAALCKDEEMGRVLTTTFMPSDYAINACGNNICNAEQLAAGQHGSDDGIVHGVKGSGKFKCIYRDADYGGCSSVCNLHDDHKMWHDPSGCSTYPDRIGFYIDSTAANAYDSDSYDLPTWDSLTQPAAVASQLREDAHSPNPLGYDSAVECQKLCDNHDGCDHWYLEYEADRFKCYLKKAYQGKDDHCHEYSFKTDKWKWATKNFHADYNGDKKFVKEGYANWGGPKSSACVSPAPYTNAELASVAGPGSTGGTITVGGRSFSIFKLNPTTGELTMVWDSGSIMETMQVDGLKALCSGCDGSTGKNSEGKSCKDYCPFNSDDSPPKMDDRSDAKGPEPECVTTGVMSDGTRLAFVGMERTGGVLTYDISDPTKPVYQDYFNVRNWMTDKVDTDPSDSDLGDFMLNDGPESMAFVSAAESPIGKELLVVATPLAGRITTYIIEAGTKRTDDGSCKDAATCPYLPKSKGGLATELAKNICDFAVGSSRGVLGCPVSDADEEIPAGVIAGIAIAVLVAVLACVGLCVVITKERAGKPMFAKLETAV